MRVAMGLLRNKYGVYYVRRKVPKRLERAVAQVLRNGKDRQTFLKQSLRTKALPDAKRKAPAVLLEFGGVIARAEALAAEKPLRTTLSQSEIERMADYFLATFLRGDEQMRRDGFDVEGLQRGLIEEGVPPERFTEFMISDPAGTRPQFGLSDRELDKHSQVRQWLLPRAERALAKADVSDVASGVAEVLEAFGINLDTSTNAYRQLGLALLKQLVKGLHLIEQRSAGKWTDTPPMPSVSKGAPATGETLRAESEGLRTGFRRKPDSIPMIADSR
jgi:hypothetical protein